MYICTCIYIYMHTHSPYIYTYIYIYIYIYIGICISLCLSLSCVDIYIYITSVLSASLHVGGPVLITSLRSGLVYIRRPCFLEALVWQRAVAQGSDSFGHPGIHPAQHMGRRSSYWPERGNVKPSSPVRSTLSMV